MKVAIRALVITAGLFLLATPDLFAQCSMCQAVLDSNPTEGRDSLAAGLNNGIIYLIVVVYLTLFLIFRKKILGFWKEFKALWD